MKLIPFFFKASIALLFLFCTITLNAQYSYKGKGKLNLSDGTSLLGEIEFKPAFANEVEIRLSPADSAKKYTTADVKSFELDSSVFEPKRSRGGEVNINNKPVFMERVADVNTGLNLYIGHFQEKVKYVMKVPLKSSEVLTLYVSIPDNSEDVFDMNSFKFIPKFDDKVSKIVAACPTLAEKIRKKENGYFYNLMNQQKAPDIWTKIVLEFAKCNDKTK